MVYNYNYSIAPLADHLVTIQACCEGDANYKIHGALRDLGHNRVIPRLCSTNDPEITKPILGEQATIDDYVNLTRPLSTYL